jgi:N-acetylneuraminic acid mutarotase
MGKLARLLATAAWLSAVCMAETWTELANISTGTLREHCTVALSSTQIVTLGGVVTGGATTNQVLVYDIPKNSWSKLTTLPVGLNHCNAAAIDGKIYVLGGMTATNAAYTWRATNASNVFDTKTGAWTALDPQPLTIPKGASAVGVYKGVIYLAGGKLGTNQKSVDNVIAFDTATLKWLTLPEPARSMGGGRDHIGGAVVGHKFYALGGRDTQTNNVKGDVYMLDLDNLAAGWKPMAKLPTPRGGLSAAAVGTKIYTFGGEGNPASGARGVFPDTEAYDTETDSWTKLKPMSVPRHGTQAAAADGKIYLPGGGRASGSMDSDVMDSFTP